MATQPDPPRGKTRTRQHVIADLGVNYVERQILLAGFSVERIIHDYGIDLWMTTYSSTGEVENETISIQVKATEHPSVSADGSFISVRVAAADLRHWLLELMPVILVLYDAANDRALWLNTQQFAEQAGVDEDESGETVTVRIPAGDFFIPDAVRVIRDLKEQARAAAKGRSGPGGS